MDFGFLILASRCLLGEVFRLYWNSPYLEIKMKIRYVVGLDSLSWKQTGS